MIKSIHSNIKTSDEFIDMLDKSIYDDNHNDICFNDEILSIEEIEPIKMIDINVTGNHLYYANDILTHNSATGSQLDISTVDNDAVSDSIGTVQTADFIMFLLQTPTMKEEGLMTCKVTKNRFNGRTDYWDVNIDYEHMRFRDALVEGQGMNGKEIKTEIATIMADDIAKIKINDNAIKDGDFDINEMLGL